jgi:predicted small integral membrane protein
MRIQKFSRPGAILMATVVVIITSMIVANAAQTFTTPNSAFVSYSLAAGANSAPITPVASRSLLVIGCCTTSGNRGVGQVSLLHIPSFNISWVGLESYAGVPAAITQGASNTVGTHIVFIDGNHVVDIQVASAGANTIQIHNGSSGTQAGNVTLVW